MDMAPCAFMRVDKFIMLYMLGGILAALYFLDIGKPLEFAISLGFAFLPLALLLFIFFLHIPDDEGSQDKVKGNCAPGIQEEQSPQHELVGAASFFQDMAFTLKFIGCASSCIEDQLMIENILSLHKIISEIARETKEKKDSLNRNFFKETNTCMSCLADILQKYMDTEFSEEVAAVTIRDEMPNIEAVFTFILENIRGTQEPEEDISHIQPSPGTIMTYYRDKFVYGQDVEIMLEEGGQGDEKKQLAGTALQNNTETTPTSHDISEDIAVLHGYLSGVADHVKNRQMAEYITTLSLLAEKILNKHQESGRTIPGSIYFGETKKIVAAYLKIESIPGHATQESARKIRDTMPDIIRIFEGILGRMWEDDAMDAEVTAQVLIEKGQMDGYLPGQMAAVQ